MSPETMLQVGLQEASANGGVCLEVSANSQGLLMCGKLLKKFGPSNQAWSASAHKLLAAALSSKTVPNHGLNSEESN